MTLMKIFSLISSLGAALFFTAFAYSSIIERKSRAFVTSLFLFITSIIVTALLMTLELPQFYYMTIDLIVLLMIAIFFIPNGDNRPMKMKAITQKVDERDTAFAREEYEAETDKFENYYKANPKYKETDERIRKLPPLLAPGGKFYDAIKSNKIKNIFSQIKSMTTSVDGDVNSVKAEVEQSDITNQIKKKVFSMGADEVGIALLNNMHVYSHVGRGPEEWGSKIENNHKFAIVFSLEMDYYRVENAPDIPITEETAEKYLKAAEISIELAEYIRSLGYPARAHISDSNYQIMLPAVAHDAGLGELGRMNYLISKKFGPRIRLGGITTDLPLTPDKPISFGAQDFCMKCLKCSDNCPPQAISTGDKVDVRGVEKWKLDVMKCLYYWRTIGTDCGLCMKVCPYSHPQAAVHNIIRAGIKRSSVARYLSVWGDDLFYGKKVKLDNFEN